MMIKECKVCGKLKEHKSWKSTTCDDCLASGIKICSKCGEVRPLKDFHLCRGKPLGMCKSCESKRSYNGKKESGYLARPDVQEMRRVASRENKRRAYADPEKRRSIYDKHNARQRARRAEDNDYRLAVNEDARLRHHARRGSLTGYDWQKACEYFDNKCAYCGAEAKLTMDHVIPVTHGGKTTANNIIPACQSCNSSKNDNDMQAWYIVQPFYSHERAERIQNYAREVMPYVVGK